VRDVVCELWEGDAASGWLPKQVGGRDEEKVRSCADVEHREVRNEGFWERL